MPSWRLPLELLLLCVPYTTAIAVDPQQRPLGFEQHAKPDVELQLRHIYHRGSSKYPLLHRRLDIGLGQELYGINANGEAVPYVATKYRASSRRASIERLLDRRPESLYTLLDDDAAEAAWTIDEIKEPDVSDMDTVLAFARMSNDAYYTAPDSAKWQDVGGGFNYTEDFGWEEDGLRGHVFADTQNKTVVIAMKGTSLPFIDPIGTINKDKINDNLLFSCCCGQGGWYKWNKVCYCETKSLHGNNTCLREAIRAKTAYYHIAQEIYHNITLEYPKADIWLAGHSLGGSIASLLGLTVGRPVVTFEAPADAMAAARLGLPTPPSFRLGNNSYNRPQGGVYHFGHTADDIFMGKCTAWNSICSLGGYAMESKCHTGQVCVFDTVKDKNWTSNARYYHGIAVVLKEVLETYKEPAKCKPQGHCRDCETWTFSDD